MSTVKSPYDEQKVDRIRAMLCGLAGRNLHRPYEIYVDRFKVVPKTENIDSFDDYLDFMDDDTKEIKIKVYHTAHSPRNDQFTFEVQKKEENAGQGLGALERVEQIVGAKLAEKDREYEARRNAEQLAECREKLEEAEEYIDTLMEKLNIAGNDRYKLKNIDLVELGSLLLGRFAEKNADMLHGLGLGNVINAPRPALPDAAPVAASFQSKNEPAPADAREKQYLDTLRQLEGHFNEQQMVGVIGILNHLMQYPEKIDTVTALLT